MASVMAIDSASPKQILANSVGSIPGISRLPSAGGGADGNRRAAKRTFLVSEDYGRLMIVATRFWRGRCFRPPERAVDLTRAACLILSRHDDIEGVFNENMDDRSGGSRLHGDGPADNHGRGHKDEPEFWL
jgi:hypothetical protein